MRTNVVIDDHLIEEALKISKIKRTKGIEKRTKKLLEKQASIKSKQDKKPISMKQKFKLEELSALGKKWAKLYDIAQGIATKTYSMKQEFDSKTSIEHKVLGWGYILTNKNDRLEVLFKDGVKTLISNYKK